MAAVNSPNVDVTFDKAIEKRDQITTKDPATRRGIT